MMFVKFSQGFGRAASCQRCACNVKNFYHNLRSCFTSSIFFFLFTPTSSCHFISLFLFFQKFIQSDVLSVCLQPVRSFLGLVSTAETQHEITCLIQKRQVLHALLVIVCLVCLLLGSADCAKCFRCTQSVVQR